MNGKRGCFCIFYIFFFFSLFLEQILNWIYQVIEGGAPHLTTWVISNSGFWWRMSAINNIQLHTPSLALWHTWIKSFKSLFTMQIIAKYIQYTCNNLSSMFYMTEIHSQSLMQNYTACAFRDDLRVQCFQCFNSFFIATIVTAYV